MLQFAGGGRLSCVSRRPALWPRLWPQAPKAERRLGHGPRRGCVSPPRPHLVRGEHRSRPRSVLEAFRNAFPRGNSDRCLNYSESVPAPNDRSGRYPATPRARLREPRCNRSQPASGLPVQLLNELLSTLDEPVREDGSTLQSRGGADAKLRSRRNAKASVGQSTSVA